MLKLSGVSKVHLAGEVQTTALDRIDLDIEAGEYVAITGPSGCGKSTLLRCSACWTCRFGEYWFEGQNVAGWSEARLNALRRGRIGFIFQSFNLIEELSVFENVELALEYTGTRRRAARARAGDAGAPGRGAPRRPPPVAAVGRPAAARGDRARAGGRPRHAAGRRTDRQPRHRARRRSHAPAAQINAEGTTVVMVTHSPAHAAQASRTLHLLDGRVVVDALQAA
jgi:putative ABC transport system ATP-binding protein